MFQMVDEMIVPKAYPPILLIALLLSAQCLLDGCTMDHPALETRGRGGIVVTDMAGRKVVIPENVSHVACMEVLCYEKLFLLGESDRISSMYQTNAPWMERTNPKVRDIPKFRGEPNMEALLNGKTDVVFFRYNPEKTIAKLAELKIPGIVSQPIAREPGSTEAFRENTKRALRLFGDVMGEPARRRAEEWCGYYDEKTRFVTERTSRLSEALRPKAYYVRGPDALTTQGRNSNTFRYGEMAGADMVVKELKMQGRTMVSMEDIVRWDPEYVFVGRQYSVDLILKDARWRNVRAVREGKVIPLPEGVFFWDGSTEGVLLMEFMAKTLHPELFADLDLAGEVKEYYARFYRYKLTSDETSKILHGLSPDGKRMNIMNN